MNMYEQAKAHQQAQRTAPPIGLLLAVGVGRLVGASIRIAWSWRVSLVWLGILGLIAGVWGRWGLVVGLVLLAAPLFWDKSRPFGIWVADHHRHVVARREARALVDGNQWARRVGLIPAADEGTYNITLVDSPEQVVVSVLTRPHGLPAARIVETAKAHRDAFDAVTVKTEQLGKGALRLTFGRVNRLDEPVILTAPADLDSNTMTVRCAVDDMGDPFSLSFANVGGVTIAGMPGSGKTAGVSSFLLPLALSPDVALTVIDGKGGTDWTAYRDRCAEFVTITEPDDLSKAVDVLERARTEMKQRLPKLGDLLGTPNFWNADAAARRAAGLPFRLLVIDEAQELFAASDPSKEAKDRAAQAIALVTTLVKVGRSAGFCVLLITQKTTADAIPTAIRDVAGVKVAFRVDTAEGERAALGSVPDDLDMPRATAIPRSRPGGAVVTRDDGSRGAVRFGYMEPARQAKLLGLPGGCLIASVDEEAAAVLG